jgi:hypothetical protein
VKTSPFLHAILALNIFIAVVGENWMAALAWVVAWALVVGYAIQIARLTKSMRAASLFIDAHNAKWPSTRAEEDAAKKLAEFERQAK